MKKNLKFIFVLGGIVSGIGKGITVASIASLLKSRGLSILPIKADPYLNKDAGTMNPYQHGEVFVTDDGAETDLDLGHYERFTDLSLTRDSNFTSGSVYAHVIDSERHGDFLGKTIQVIPHVTDEIKRRIITPAKKHKPDITIVEVGGTIGDIEGEPFLEAARQIHRDYGSENVKFVQVVKIDYIFPSDESKTKPIQQSVALLRSKGIQPNFLIVRCKRPLSKDNQEKISLFTSVPKSHIIQGIDVATTVYETPLNFKKAHLDDLILEEIGVRPKKPDFVEWRHVIQRVKSIRKNVKIALVGKYTEHSDAYISVEEALFSAGIANGAKVEIVHIDAENDNIFESLEDIKGILVPGGFGRRGIEGKIAAIQYAREHKIPFLGLCLGLQTAVIEFARNKCGLKGANSTEFDAKTPHPVVDILAEQKNVKNLGGTMRLGSWKVRAKKGTLVAKLYGKQEIAERHRHRYEVNPKYHATLEKHGLVLSGFAKSDNRLVDFIELPGHPFFVATQAHPEFKSRFLVPHPLFLGFIGAALK